MKRRILIPLICACLIAVSPYAQASHSVSTVVNTFINDVSIEERNRIFKEDIEYFAKQLPARHKYMFSKLSKDEFERMTAELIQNVSNLNDTQIFIELNKIVAAIGDAHTNVTYSGLMNNIYPIRIYFFKDEPYIIDVDKANESLMNAKILKINGHDIDDVLKQLKPLISYENESWASYMLTQYLIIPTFMYGLGLIPDEKSAVFTVEKDGQIFDKTVYSKPISSSASSLIYAKKDNLVIGRSAKTYDYNYLDDSKALYFQYNSCWNDPELSFADFNKQMFKNIENKKVDKIIIDLRSNSGGNSAILNPFTEQLKKYIKENPNLKVYTLISCKTFSSGIFAILDIKAAVPNMIVVGEPSGGSVDAYGELREFGLPNSKISVGHSVKFFELSKVYSSPYKGSYIPDIEIKPTFEDFLKGFDPVLDYALKH